MGQVHKGVWVGVRVRTHGVWLQSSDYYLEYFGFTRFSFHHMASGLQRKAFLGLLSVAALFVFLVKLLEQWALDS